MVCFCYNAITDHVVNIFLRRKNVEARRKKLTKQAENHGCGFEGIWG